MVGGLLLPLLLLGVAVGLERLERRLLRSREARRHSVAARPGRTRPPGHPVARHRSRGG